MKIVGYTEDQKPVVAGVFEFSSTYGLPLEDIVYRFKEHHLVVSWPHYILEAIGAGQNERVTFSKIENALSEVYGSEALRAFKQFKNHINFRD